jgi:hypothetical protein
MLRKNGFKSSLLNNVKSDSTSKIFTKAGRQRKGASEEFDDCS